MVSELPRGDMIVADIVRLSNEANLAAGQSWPSSATDRIVNEHSRLLREVALRLALAKGSFPSDVSLGDYFRDSFELERFEQEHPELSTDVYQDFDTSKLRDYPFEWVGRATQAVGDLSEKAFWGLNSWMRGNNFPGGLAGQAGQPAPSKAPSLNNQETDLINLNLDRTYIQHESLMSIDSLGNAASRLTPGQQIIIAGPGGQDLALTNNDVWNFAIENIDKGNNLNINMQSNGLCTTCTINLVEDGDTVIIDRNTGVRVSPLWEGSRTQEYLRFNLVDTPETEHFMHQKYAEFGGQEATEFVVRSLEGREYLVQYLYNKDGSIKRGFYGRPIVDIYTKDPTDNKFYSLNTELVKAGLARIRPSEEALRHLGRTSIYSFACQRKYVF
jgi:endonuclease YncB( thermonuclease family)